MADSRKRRSESARDVARYDDGVYSYSIDGPERVSQRPSDSLQDILETLESEHGYIASLLDTLEEQAERLKPGKVPDFHMLHEIVDYLIHYPSQYHHPREDLLFFKMLDSNKGLEPQLKRLQREHETLGHFTQELFSELTLAVEGRPVDRPALRRTIVNYIDGYRRHMEYEATDVFPHARGSLSGRDIKRLAQKTRYVDDPLFGRELQYRYQRLRRDVRTRLDLAGQELLVREMQGIEMGIEYIARVLDKASRARKRWTGWCRRQRQG